MYKRLAYLSATYLGIGRLPFAPGTMGSLATLPLVWLAAYFFGIWGLLCLIIGSFVEGLFATREVLKYEKHDPSFVVIDEVTGQSLAFVLVAPHLNIWWVYVLGFALFRLFDICKFGPVKWADQKLLNEWGVMVDDVIAGLFAAVALRAILVLPF